MYRVARNPAAGARDPAGAYSLVAYMSAGQKPRSPLKGPFVGLLWTVSGLIVCFWGGC